VDEAVDPGHGLFQARPVSAEQQDTLEVVGERDVFEDGRVPGSDFDGDLSAGLIAFGLGRGAQEQAALAAQCVLED
jgi:hypothetical protein